MHPSYPFPTIFSLITISSLPPHIHEVFWFSFFYEPLHLTRDVCVALGFKLSIRAFWAYLEYTSEVNDCLSPLLINISQGQVWPRESPIFDGLMTGPDPSKAIKPALRSWLQWLWYFSEDIPILLLLNSLHPSSAVPSSGPLKCFI